MAGVIEDVGIFLDLALAHGLQRAKKAAANAHGISDIAESVRDGPVAGIHVAIEFLGRACATEEAFLPALGMHAGPTEKTQEAETEKLAQFTGDAAMP